MLEGRFYALEDYLLNNLEVYKNYDSVYEKYISLLSKSRLFNPCIYEYTITGKSLSGVNRLIDILTKIDLKEKVNLDALLSATLVDIKVKVRYVLGGIEWEN